MIRSRGSLLGAAVIAVLTATPIAATTIVPMQLEDLAASAELVITGDVESIVHAELADGRIVSRVSIIVDEAWKGDPPQPLVLVERGGIVGEVGEMIYGAPSYQRGEPVVVFASRTALGWQTNHMLQGKFRIVHSPGGETSATRQVGEGVAVLSGHGEWRDAIPLDELRAVASASPPPAAALSSIAFDDLEVVGETIGAFTTQNGNPRYFEADLGRPLDYLIDSRGDSIVGLEVSRRAIGDAFAAWNAVADTSLVIRDVGTTDDIGAVAIDGVNRVLFDDPGNEILDPTNCSGTLAIGGSRFSPVERKTFDGRTFSKILSANVKFADNWDGCAVWMNECNFSEVAAHEGGHSFGLGHSSQNPNEGNADLRQALMYFNAHFDGRCADPRNDDMAGIRAIYPAAIPITITTDQQLPEAVANQPYSFQLSVAGGRGPIAWTTTDVCNDVDGGLELSASGRVEGNVGNFTGNGCIEAIATDADGESHQKRFLFNFALAPSTPSPTQPTATAPPTPTRPANTPTATIPAVRPCIGDCNQDGRIVISELIRGVNIALRNTDVSSCPSFDRDSNGTVSIAELIASVTAALFGCTS